MNKLFVVVLLAGFGACSVGALFGPSASGCNVEVGCGRNKCCLLGIFCAPKLQANAPCKLQSRMRRKLRWLHKCGCADGLECKVTHSFIIFGRKVESRQCRAAEVPVVPKEINTEPRQEKRFLLRDCNNDSQCGVERCCSSVLNKCFPVLPLDSPCATNSCCGEGKECRVTYTLYNPISGKKIYEVRQCKLASEPSEAQAIEVSEA